MKVSIPFTVSIPLGEDEQMHGLRLYSSSEESASSERFDEETSTHLVLQDLRDARNPVLREHARLPHLKQRARRIEADKSQASGKQNHA